MVKARSWMLIPDAKDPAGSGRLAAAYAAAWEYNDFFRPEVYGNPEALEKRIELWCSLPRDRSRDTIHGAFLDVAIASTDSAIREHSRRLVAQSAQIAHRMGLRGVVYHTGLIASLNYGSYRQAWLTAAEETFRPLCRRYPDLCIYMENTFETSPEVFTELMQRMGDLPNFKLCLDYGHAVLSPTAPEVWVETLAPYIGHIHLNDNDLEKDLHLVPGEGKLDFAQCFRLLDAHGIDAPILLELTGAEAQESALAFVQAPADRPQDHPPVQSPLDTILSIAISLSMQTDTTQLLNTILTQSMRIARCDAGTLYILRDGALHFSLMKTLSQGIDRGSSGETIDLPPVPVSRENISAYTVLTKKPLRIDDVYQTDLFDFSGPKRYDAMTGYHTGSILAVPLLNQENEVIGVMQLINALDRSGEICPFSEKAERIIFALSSLAAIELCSAQYTQQLREQMWSFTEAMAEAIDRRTPYNANHIRNVAKYAQMVAEYINTLHDRGETEEYFDEKRRDGLVMGALLHDIGKLVIPLEIMNKPTRLGDCEGPLLRRLELLACKYEILYLKQALTRQAYDQKLLQLQQIRTLVQQVNTAGFLPDDLMDRLQEVFDLVYDFDGEQIPYFTDREKEFLSVRKGTLTAGEREIMESHVTATETILQKVQFNSYFKDSARFAAQHHEFLNGQGYPRHLTAEDLPLESRILAAADIFDALLATDRPYKKSMPREKAVAILMDMASCGQLDETVCHYLDAATNRSRTERLGDVL